MDTLWTAVAPKQKGPFDSKKLQLYKLLSKMAVQALAPKCNRNLKTLTHSQLPATLKLQTPFMTVTTFLKNSQNPIGPAQANQKTKHQM